MRYFSFYILQCLILSILVISCASCESDNQETNNNTDNDSIEFYFGSDLSYVNEMEDCGAVYKDQSGVEKEVYSIFKQEGTNLVRLRLWHNPDWTDYSNYSDVKKAIQRAKNSNMKVLLDFHYSDTWADPSRQLIPEAWLSELNNTEALGELLYNYTYNTLNELSQENLLPEIVQVGNEINTMILQEDETNGPIDWQRNSYLINKGIKAIRDISELKNKPIEIMLHIAQPENGLWWFEQATTNGITDFDWIGLSYYPLWSEYELDEVQVPLETLINTYNKKLMIVETAYPFTLNNADSANNILGEEALTGDFPASEQGQLDYLNQLYIIIKDAGGQGLVYWEPAWVSTNCFTQWAQGSHWDNATLFDNSGKATLGIKFYNKALNN
ncbi:arabinogalactan endo-beta-1,4-galactanase [Winogradskyella sp. A2]|uniref:glycoside hydrolase family 53 protein n=1 Tax=Winogradskyella sp. A2 TaxID=3366944 RepID=UPI00398C5CD0